MGPEVEKSTRKKGYAPSKDSGDYKISSIEIEEAENGVVVNCCYSLTDEAKDKVMKSSGEKYVPYDVERYREKNVFESKAKAKKHIVSELNAMWNDGASPEDEDGDEE